MRFDYSKIDVVHMLESLGVQVEGLSGDEVYYHCPFSGHAQGDASSSASMNETSTGFNCWACGAHGTAVTFVSMLLNVSPWKAKQFLREAYMRGFREPVGPLWDELKDLLDKTPEDFQRTRVTPDESEVDRRRIDWAKVARSSEAPLALRYLLDRGFKPRILDAWDIGWDSVSNRISIPVRNEHGILVGFKGRAVEDWQQPKYLVLGGPRYGFDTYEVSSVLFGAHREHAGTAVVCEGELNVLALDQSNVQGPTATGGSKISHRQLAILTARYSAAVVWPDDDPAGHGGRERAVELIHALMPMRLVDAKDDAAATPEEERLPLVQSAVSPILAKLKVHMPRVDGV